MPLGRGLPLNMPSKLFAGAAVDPLAAFSLSLYLDGADYVAATGAWPGRASAGASGSTPARKKTAVTQPTAGATLNGIQTVAFAHASTQYLEVPTSCLSIFSTAAWSMACLIYVNSNTNYSWLGDQTNGYIYADVRVGGTSATFTAWPTAPPSALDNFGSWELVQFRCDGAHQEARVNSGAWVQSAATTINAGATTFLNIGAIYTSTNCLDGRIASLVAAPTGLTRANFDTIKTALNSRWGLAL